MKNLAIKVSNVNYLRAASCYVRMTVFVLERNLELRR